MTFERASFQPIMPCMASTRRDLTDSISAAHSISCGSTSTPNWPAIQFTISPSMPISLPSFVPVPGMSPL